MPPHLMIEYNYLIRQWNGGITIEKLHLRISVFNNFFRKKKRVHVIKETSSIPIHLCIYHQANCNSEPKRNTK
jgi:hypothetical protein